MAHPEIYIVEPSWLESCEKENQRVSETSHPIRGPVTPATKHLTYPRIFEMLLRDSNNVDRSLFEFHQFYLMGFDGEEAGDVKRLLGKAIRRLGGTIQWDLSDDITMLILHDTCHEALR